MDPHNPLLQWWLIGAAFCSVIGIVIGMGKGATGAGFFYGLLLGPLGLVLVAVAEDTRIQCPVCRGMINPMAAVCPKCRSSMLKLGRASATHGQREMDQELAELAPPRVVPKVRPKSPRIVAHATKAVSQVTQTLAKMTQALDNVPRLFTGKPMKVIRTAPRGTQTAPLEAIAKVPQIVEMESLQVIPKTPQIVRMEPPRVIPRVPKVVERAPRFFILKPGDEIRGPYDLAQIQALTEYGALTEGTQFCREGDNIWNPSPVA